MHSSGKRTALLVDRIPAYTVQGGVYPSMHWAGGGVCILAGTGQGGVGVCPEGVYAQGGCLPRGVSAIGPLGVCL